MHREIKRYLDKRRKSLRSGEYAFGTAIKAKRLALQYTLEEVAEDVCSISYLSKVENFQIIPSMEKRILLEEKLQLSALDKEVYDFSDLTNDWILFLSHPDKDVENRLLSYPIEENHKGFFHRHVLSLTLKKDLNFPIKMLFEYFNAYSEEQIFILLYLQVSKDIAVHYSKRAYEILNWIELEYIKDKTLLYVYYKIKTHLDFDLHLIQNISKDYETYSKLAIELNLLDDIKLLYEKMKVIQGLYAYFPKAHHTLPLLESYRAYFTKDSVSFYYDINLDQLYHIIFAYKFNVYDVKFIAENLKESDHLVYQFIKIKATQDQELLIDFIRHMIISEPLSHYDYISVHFLLNESIKELSLKHYYKDALLMSQRLLIETRSMIKA